MTYRPEIDGLRALAVVAVVLFHARVPGFEGGFVGVDVFLVLSGYLIAQQLRARPDVTAFLVRRIRRLMPMMLVVCLASVPFAWMLLLPAQFKDFGQSLVAGPLFLGNLLFWQEAGYFAETAAAKPHLHLWSLGLEGQFYLAMPFLILLRKGGLALLAAVSFGFCVWASWHAPATAFFLLPARLWEFLAGALLALYAYRGAAWLVPLGLVLIGAAILLLDGAMAIPGALALLPVAGTVAVLAAQPSPGVLTVAPVVWLGRLSYSIYLWHHPVFVFAAIAVPAFTVLYMLPVLLPLILVLSWASWRLIEQPQRQRQDLRQIVAGAGALAMLGIALHVAQGAPNRLPASAQTVLERAERGPMPCHDAHSVSELAHGTLCRIGAPDATAQIALIGDSHAGHLTRALDAALRTQGRAAVVLSRSWCLPLPDFGTNAPSRGPECARFMAEGWARLAGEPEVRVIVMAAQWANGIAGARGDLLPVTYRFEGAQFPDNGQAFAAALGSLKAAPALLSRRLILVEPVPEYPSAVPAAVARALWSGKGDAGVGVPLDYTHRNGDALAALAWFESATRATVVHSARILCPQGPPCPILDGDVPLYRDASHLSRSGAARLVAALLEVLDDPS